MSNYPPEALSGGPKEQELIVNVTRAEWLSLAAFLMSIATLVFGMGTVWQQQQDHDRRLLLVEQRYDAMVVKVERIDANVAFLAERAREDRARMKP